MDESASSPMLSSADGSVSATLRTTGHYCGGDPTPKTGAGLALSGYPRHRHHAPPSTPDVHVTHPGQADTPQRVTLSPFRCCLRGPIVGACNGS